MAYYMGAGNKRRKVALLSRFPVRTFMSVHPLFPIWRNFVNAEIEYEPDKTIRLIGIHPVASLGFAFEVWRLWEAKYIIDHIRNFLNMPCLIAGDFNAIAPKDRIRRDIMPKWLRWLIYLQGNRVYHFSVQAFLSAGFTDCFRFLNPDMDGYTLPPPNPNSRLDYILANAKMKAYLKRCWVVREPDDVHRASDHYPVMAEFSFT